MWICLCCGPLRSKGWLVSDILKSLHPIMRSPFSSTNNGMALLLKYGSGYTRWARITKHDSDCRHTLFLECWWFESIWLRLSFPQGWKHTPYQQVAPKSKIWDVCRLHEPNPNNLPSWGETNVMNQNLNTTSNISSNRLVLGIFPLQKLISMVSWPSSTLVNKEKTPVVAPIISK